MSAWIPAHVVLEAPEAPRATALVLHGILGSAANWRGFVRGLVARAPASSAVRHVRWVLADLRGHGASSPQAAPPPHTVSACAADLERLGAALSASAHAFQPDGGEGHPATPLGTSLGVPRSWGGLTAPETSAQAGDAGQLKAPFDLVLGHSFGGKVALAYARDAALPPRATWFLDTPPGADHLAAHPDTARRDELASVFEAIESIGETVPPRVEVTDRLLARGLSPRFAAWMSTNVRGDADRGYAWKFDLPTVRALIQDYFALDLRPFVRAAAASSARGQLRCVIGGQSSRFDAEERAWLDSIQGLERYELPTAGHWLHVDDPEGLARCFEVAASEVCS